MGEVTFLRSKRWNPIFRTMLTRETSGPKWFLIIHFGLFCYIIYNISCVIKDFRERSASIPEENQIENIIIEPMSLKSETSGLY